MTKPRTGERRNRGQDLAYFNTVAKRRNKELDVGFNPWALRGGGGLPSGQRLREQGVVNHTVLRSSGDGEKPRKMGFPGGSDGKESTYKAGDPGSIPGLGRSPGEGNTHSSILAWEIHGQKSPVGYGLWGCKESNMTEQLIRTSR